MEWRFDRGRGTECFSTMGLVRTAGALLTVPTATTAFGISAIGAELVGRRDGAELCARLWCDALLGSMGVTVRSHLHESIDRSRTYVLVSNHQSHVDVPVIIRHWPGPVRFVAKKSLSFIPVFGQALYVLGHVFIDRGKSETAKARLSRQVEPVRKEVSVLFFAEGTRSASDELLPFKKGCLYLAEAAGVPIVPVAVQGTRFVLPRDHAWVEPGRVGVVFGEPMPHLSDPGVPREERLGELRARVEELCVEAEALRS